MFAQAQKLNCQFLEPSQYHLPCTYEALSSRTNTSTPDASIASLFTHIQPLSGMPIFPQDNTSNPIPFSSADWLAMPNPNPSQFHVPPTWDADYTLPIVSGGNYGVAVTSPTIPNSATASLTTLSGMPFALPSSDCQFSSSPSSLTSTPNTTSNWYFDSHLQAPPIWNSPLPPYNANYGVEVPLHGSFYPAPGEGIFGIPQIKDAAPAGPKRVEKSRKRQAPYRRVDKDHEGAKNKNLSQQGFVSETPGYENFGHDDNMQKSPTKRRNTRKLHPSGSLQPVAGPSASIDRNRVGVSNQKQRRNTRTTPPTPTVTMAPLDSNGCDSTKTIRSHGRSKKRGCPFIYYE